MVVGRERPESEQSAPGRGFDTVVDAIPYVMLAVSLIITLTLDPRPWPETARVLGVTAVAFAWVAATMGSPLTPATRHSQRRLVVYIVGILALTVALMTMAPLFFLVALTGFFHAGYLKPLRRAVGAIFVTSLVINGLILGLPDPTRESITIYVIVVAVQTVGIGFGVSSEGRFRAVADERQRTVADLEAALSENAELQALLVAHARETGILDERQRMAREIHDTLAQGLTGVVTQLEAAQHTIDDPVELRRRLDHAAALARESLSEARRSVQAVIPAPLEDSRLPDAIAEVAARWSERNGVTVQMATTGTAERLHPEVEVTLLRVAQEALANVSKHAGATRVGVTLSYMDDVVSLDVRDDGSGFDVVAHDAPDNRAPHSGAPDNGAPHNGAQDNGAPVDRGFGLTAMRQRVEGLSGDLDIESELGAGTAISASLPAVTEGGLRG